MAYNGRIALQGLVDIACVSGFLKQSLLSHKGFYVMAYNGRIALQKKKRKWTRRSVENKQKHASGQ